MSWSDRFLQFLLKINLSSKFNLFVIYYPTLNASEDFRFLDIFESSSNLWKNKQKISLNKRLRLWELQAKPVLLPSSSLIHQAIFLFNVWGIYLEAILIWVSNGLQVDWFTAQTFSKSSRSMERNKEKKIQWPIHLRCKNFAFRSFFCF